LEKHPEETTGGAERRVALAENGHSRWPISAREGGRSGPYGLEAGWQICIGIKKEWPVPRKAFSAEGAVSIGPYSHAVESGATVYLSGQTPVASGTGKLVEGGIAIQTEQCFKNLFSVLEAAGLSPDDVVKVNVFLCDMDDFGAMNSVYEKRFSAPFPARTTVGVAALPLQARVEIEMIARRS
jgi:2-iminobutanoate/2-iminopropanoate deaminase